MTGKPQRSAKQNRDAVKSAAEKKKTPAIRPEELTVGERTALAEKGQAARQRARPPSI